MIHPEELAHILAQTLVKPVETLSEILNPVYEGQYNLLRKKFVDNKEYSEELKRFVKSKQAYIEKQIQSHPFIVENYLSSAILKSFDTLGAEGGTYFEHDSIRKLFTWYKEDRNFKYRYHYSPNTSNFGKVEVIAESGSGKKKETISFKFEYLKEKLETAAMLNVFVQLIEKVKSDEFYSEDQSIESNEIKANKEKGETKAPRQKLSWMENRKIIKNIFSKLSNHSFEVNDKKVLDASDTEIEETINNNFDFSAKPTSVAAKETSHKLLYNGDISALIRLLYFLSIKKLKNGSCLLNAPKDAIISFVHNNFLWHNKEENTDQTIEMKTLLDLWGKTKRVYNQDYDKLLADENNSKKKDKSVLNIISAELSSI